MTGSIGTERLTLNLAFWFLVLLLVLVSSYFTWSVEMDMKQRDMKQPFEIRPETRLELEP